MTRLKRRFILLAMIAFAVVMAVLATGINLINWKQTTSAQEETLQKIIQYDTSVSERPAEVLPFEGQTPWDVEQGREFTARFFVVHCNKDGIVSVFNDDYISSVSESDVDEYVHHVLGRPAHTGRYEDYRYLITESDEQLTIAFLNVADADDFSHKLLIATALGALGCLVLVFFLTLALAGPAVRPFEKNAERQRRFVTDAGHELKTPVTSIATSIDIVEIEQGGSEWVDNIKNQTNRLARLIEDLVSLSRLDESNTGLNFERFSLSNAVWEIVESFTQQAEACRKRIDAHIEEDIFLTGDEGSIQKLVSILLDNALKYAKGETPITLDVHTDRGKAHIQVSNTCDLDALGDPNRLFDRFYRPDDARSREAGGYGIGLSMAESIAQAHKGKIAVAITQPDTITFTVTL